MTARNIIVKATLAAVLALSLAGSNAVPALAATTSTTKNCSVSTPLENRPTLQYGDRGSCVTVAQGLLRNWNAYNRVFGTEFGPITEAGVKQVQRQKNLDEDGVIGQDTWKVLASTSPATKRALTSTTSSATKNCDNQHYRTICVIKNASGANAMLYAIENGKVVMRMTVRVGDSDNSYTQTSEGNFTVQSKDDTTNYAMPFDGDQAIRYSDIYRRCGVNGNLYNNRCVTDYRGASNGGVDISSKSSAQKLYQWSNTGTEIVILNAQDAKANNINN